MSNKAKQQSKIEGKTFLKERFVDIEKAFIEELKRKQREITHAGALGDAWEDAWMDLLKKYLPNRYCIAKAFAVDSLGNTTDQLDCLIYDAHFTPALFGKDKHLYVPAEAVYASFEVKAEVNSSHLKYAAEKAVSLRKLKRTSAPLKSHLGISKPKKPQPIITGLLALNASWQDGLGKKFLENYKKLNGQEKLDFILTAESGFCEGFKKRTSIISGEGSLIRGLFRLLSALRDKATVAAIDWEKYEDVFS